MREEFNDAMLRVLVLISSPKLTDKANILFESNRFPLQYQLHGQGTASSEMMDMLGLGSVKKMVSVSIMPKPYAADMLAQFNSVLDLGKSNTGIAFTTAITGISGAAIKILNDNLRKEFQESMENDTKQVAENSKYSLITIIINQGYSEELMDVARQAGAHGGTVMNARQIGAERIASLFGTTLQEEKEIILILEKADAKLAIMKAIGEKYGMFSEARGVILSSAIDMISGLD